MNIGGHIDLEVGFSPESAPRPRDPERPFQIALLGDFSGRAQRALTELSPRLVDREIHRVDRDNLDGVIGKLGPKLRLDAIGTQAPPVSMRFERLDDFHPEHLFGRLDLFRVLLKTRSKLADPSTFEETAREVAGWIAGGSERAPSTARPTPEEPPRDDSTDLVTELLAERESEVREREKAAGIDVSALIAGVVRQHVQPDVEQDQQRLLATVDRAIGEQMRRVLHHPRFQDLEAAWRGVDFLVRRLETDSTLRIHVLDVCKEELLQDFRSADAVESSGIFKLLVEQTVGTPGGQPWAVLIGNYTFDGSAEDAELLFAVAEVARRAGAPFVAGASPELLGCKSLAKTPDPDDWKLSIDPERRAPWEALRERPSASWVGLVLPRMLLRLPYGKETDPVHSFEFEESSGTPQHNEYLWGNSAFACAYLLGQGFSEEGWGFDPADYRDLEDLPAHVYRAAGQSVMKPPTEAWLTDRAIREILGRGLTPLVGIKGTNAARLPVLVSVTKPAMRLSGPWSG